MEKLQRQYRKKLQKLKKEQERLKEQQKFVNILLLQSRSPKRGLFFPSPIYSSSFHKSSPISRFERAFEAIRKNERDYKETLRRYSFRKPKRQVGFSEQVGLIFISNFEEDQHRPICNNNNNCHYIKRSTLESIFQKELIFPIRSTQRKQVNK